MCKWIVNVCAAVTALHLCNAEPRKPLMPVRRQHLLGDVPLQLTHSGVGMAYSCPQVSARATAATCGRLLGAHLRLADTLEA